ncbi:hypothetical protein ACFFIY_12240 [Bhargavaea ullalensis]|uniref:Uncharacterized protein n=1 Tax=Bhargavaea ullalensis TaxID=1265685 RepID=A0ABV2G7I4_9BACL
MLELLISLAEAVLDLWPSDRNRTINRRVRLLKECGVYEGLKERYGPVVLMNREFREFIYSEKVEDFADDWEKMEGFLHRLDGFVKREGL